MPNPYDDIFNDSPEKKETPTPGERKNPLFTVDLDDPRFQNNGPETLTVILQNIGKFNERAASFAQLLSKLRAIDHQDNVGLKRLFVANDGRHDQGSLAGEKNYHLILRNKFASIIAPMRELAEIHRLCLESYNREVDEHYFSVERTDAELKEDREAATRGINLQRSVLADAASDLDTLKDALVGTEIRLKQYINRGGKNNLSPSEYEMIVRLRKPLTAGETHSFDYTFFDINLLDKAALSLGIFMPETTKQYLGGLGDALRKM